MKVKSIIVLFAVVVSVLSPLSLHLTIAHGSAAIEGLDVCHAGSLALAPGHDAPCVSEPLYRPSLPSHIERTELPDPTLRIPVIAFREEHPPQA